MIRQIGIRQPRVYVTDHNEKLISRYKQIAVNYIKHISETCEDFISKRIYHFGDITVAEESLRRGYKEFIRTDLKDKKLRKIIENIEIIVRKEIKNALDKRELVHVIAPSATKIGEWQNAFYVYEMYPNRNMEYYKCIYDNSEFRDEHEGDKDKIGRAVLSKPINLFITKAYDTVKSFLSSHQS